MRGRHRKSVRRIVMAILRCKGPLTDAELAWWARVALATNPQSAKRCRWSLTREELVRFAGKVKLTAAGRVQKLWEATRKGGR